jgi:hypothetical protein
MGGLMKIRDHPSLLHWPPEWIASFGNDSLPPDRREDLVLREVELLPTTFYDYHCYIRVVAENWLQPWKTYTSNATLKTYTGIKTGKIYTSIIIFLRDSEFLDRLLQKLQGSIGRTIREIGDSEI